MGSLTSGYGAIRVRDDIGTTEVMSCYHIDFHLQSSSSYRNDNLFLPCTPSQYISLIKAETEFLDVIGTKVLRVFLLAIYSQSPLLTDFTTPPPPQQKWFEIGLQCKQENRKFENSQDYAQKPQRNFTFMNSESGCSWIIIAFGDYRRKKGRYSPTSFL